MVSKTLTISLPEHLLEFLQDNKGLSASKVMQSALISIQDSIRYNPKLIECRREIEQQKKAKNKTHALLMEANKFIDDEGLWEKFSKSF